MPRRPLLGLAYLICSISETLPSWVLVKLIPESFFKLLVLIKAKKGITWTETAELSPSPSNGT